MKKRSLAFFLCVALLCALWVPLIPAVSAADITDSGTCGENLTWTLDSDGVLTISGTGEMEDYSLDGLPQWWWSDWSFTGDMLWSTAVKTVVIENGVTDIGDYAFAECAGLTNVTLSESVTHIGNGAFFDCTSLTDITLPKGVTHIGENAFYGCTGLTDIALPESVTHIGRGAFVKCTALTSFTIPKGVTSIWDTFSGCTGLTSITIPEGVTYIGSYTFSNCTGLTGITIPKSVTFIGGDAFYGCTGLTSITIPESVTCIGDYGGINDAFRGCTALSEIQVDEKNTAFCSDELGILYNKEMTRLIHAPAKAKLGHYTVPESVTHILDSAFEYCNNLTDVTISEGVTSIGSSAFASCSNLTNITISKSVKYIESFAFRDCTGLTSVFIPEGVKGLGSGIFMNCDSLTGIGVDEKNMSYCSDEVGVLYNKEKTALLEAPAGVKLGNYAIPGSVTSIGGYAFSGCIGLTGITIPEGIADIGYRAFSDCTGLTNVTIPDGIANIEGGTFYGCTGLTDLTIPKSVTFIGAEAFYNCNGLSSIIIPDGVTSIGDGAFSGCTGLTSIIIPENVTRLGFVVFAHCDALTSVCFKGDAPMQCWETFGAYDEVTGKFYAILGLTLYYIEGKEGWTTPEWNGYPTATWDGVNVPKGHEHDYKATVTAPMCTEKGYTTYACAICEDSYVADEVAALGHAWDEGKVTTVPTTEKEGVKTFTCTRCNTTKTEPIDKLQASVSFKDVDEKAYYAAAVKWAVAKNITKGTAADTFAPNDTCTRGQIVTFLWRAAGEPKPSGAKNPFTDVKQSDYWYNAVLWAVEQGITTGTSATTFSPNEGCTRGQVATFLWRYENKPTPEAVNPFEDVKIGAYYYDAVLWAVEADVTKGTSATTFAPNDTCTRGQIVTFLYRDIAR